MIRHRAGHGQTNVLTNKLFTWQSLYFPTYSYTQLNTTLFHPLVPPLKGAKISPVQYQTCSFHASRNILRIPREWLPLSLKVVQRPAPHHHDGSHARTADPVTAGTVPGGAWARWTFLQNTLFGFLTFIVPLCSSGLVEMEGLSLQMAWKQII